MTSDPTALDTELFEKFNNETLAAADLTGEKVSWCDKPQPLEPIFTGADIIDSQPQVQSKPPIAANLTGIEEDIAFCRRTAGAIDELLTEAGTITANIAIGGEYAKAHAWLVRNNKADTTRIGWRRAFEKNYFPHKRRQAEDLICIHTVFVGTAVPANFPHNLRAQRLLARQVKSEKLSLEGLRSFSDSNAISPLSTEAEVRLVLGLKTKSGKSGSTTAMSDLAVILGAATDDEMKTALRTRDVPWLLRVIPEEWLSELQARVINLRTGHSNGTRVRPHLTASEGLRRALSLVKTAGTAPITPAAAASYEREALTALRQLNAILAHFETDEITIVRQHAKENRCTKGSRRGRSHSRRRAV
jgi:hypothetical protein